MTAIQISKEDHYRLIQQFKSDRGREWFMHHIQRYLHASPMPHSYIVHKDGLIESVNMPSPYQNQIDYLMNELKSYEQSKYPELFQG